MLCSLARRAFKQTEEQQLQFEQILKHDYGRRSKGEVHVYVHVYIYVYTHYLMHVHCCIPPLRCCSVIHYLCVLTVTQILAKELAGQLQVLENNAHPFYKPKLFVVREI